MKRSLSIFTLSLFFCVNTALTDLLLDHKKNKFQVVDIAGFFIDNLKVGKLFIIKGNVVNGYSEIRENIKIIGKLYSKDRGLLTSETAVCGNILLRVQLQELTIKKIKAHLQKPYAKVFPGELIPFMVVFSNLTSEENEYTLEIIDSTPYHAA